MTNRIPTDHGDYALWLKTRAVESGIFQAVCLSAESHRLAEQDGISDAEKDKHRSASRHWEHVASTYEIKFRTDHGCHPRTMIERLMVKWELPQPF